MGTRYLIRFGVLLVVGFILLARVDSASAAPAAPIEIELTQPDGSTFAARQWGDEWQNGYETETGYTILLEPDGWWVYAAAARDGTLAPQLSRSQDRLLVGESSPEGLTPHLRPAEVSRPSDAFSGELSPNLGSQPTLVLLVKFNNFAETYAASTLQSKIFGAANSVRDFYLDASFNQLTITPASESDGIANDGVVGWLTLPYPRPVLGGTPDNDNQTIVKDALSAANSAINYAQFDSNGDGYISNTELHIVVVVAGNEQSFGGDPASSVWGHRWNLNNIGAAFLDNKWLGYSPYGGYAQFGEVHGDHAATIGIIAHELGHDLTWPDLYDTDQSSEGVGDWSIMGGGSWNNTVGGFPGNSPAMPDAFLKWYQGWITPTAVSGIQSGVVINQAETNAQAYLIGTNPGGVNWNFDVSSGTGEYFLLENRQLTGYDVGLPGCGLLITHIDESVTSENDANANEFHPLVKIIEADGLDQLVGAVNRGDTGDPFPGATNNTAFNFNTTPNSRFYNNADSLAAVSNISSCGSAMTATLSFGSVPMNNKVFLPLIMNGNPPAPGVDSIRNGTFEAGQDGNWSESSTGEYDLITTVLPGGVTPHGGSWAVWLGGADNETSTLTQAGIQVGGQRYLHYWYRINSEDSCGYDFVNIYVNSTSLATIDLCVTENTAGWVHGMLDMIGYSGMTITLKFELVNDFMWVSNFYLDDISLSASPAFVPFNSPTSLEGVAAAPKR